MGSGPRGGGGGYGGGCHGGRCHVGGAVAFRSGVYFQVRAGGLARRDRRPSRHPATCRDRCACVGIVMLVAAIFFFIFGVLLHVGNFGNLGILLMAAGSAMMLFIAIIWLLVNCLDKPYVRKHTTIPVNQAETTESMPQSSSSYVEPVALQNNDASTYNFTLTQHQSIVEIDAGEDTNRDRLRYQILPNNFNHATHFDEFSLSDQPPAYSSLFLAPAEPPVDVQNSANTEFEHASISFEGRPFNK